MTVSTSAGQSTLGLACFNVIGASLRRMISDSRADSLGKGSRPVSMLKATSPSE